MSRPLWLSHFASHSHEHCHLLAWYGRAYDLWSFQVIPPLGHILASDRDSYQVSARPSSLRKLAVIVFADPLTRCLRASVLSSQRLVVPRREYPPVPASTTVCRHDPRSRVHGPAGGAVGAVDVRRRVYPHGREGVDLAFLVDFRWMTLMLQRGVCARRGVRSRFRRTQSAVGGYERYDACSKCGYRNTRNEQDGGGVF